MNVVIYLRVSSEQQADRELSIPAQREALQRYADECGWNIADEYVDEAKSAKTDARPAFQRMIAAAQQPDKNFEAIVVHKFDRFSRSREDHVVYKSLLKKCGVLVLSALEPTEPNSPHGVLLEGMLEVISEWYSMNLKHETLKGMRENAIQGFHCGGRVPFGYRRVQEGAKVFYELATKQETDLIVQIFRMAADGFGGKRIAKELNIQALVPGKRWTPSTVLSILRNQVYLGRRVWNRKRSADRMQSGADDLIVTEDAHPKIIDMELWNAAQASLLSRRQSK